ncbi:glycosyltransferase [Lachnospiraceae bacterium LCP25S3_G4]
MRNVRADVKKHIDELTVNLADNGNILYVDEHITIESLEKELEKSEEINVIIFEEFGRNQEKNYEFLEKNHNILVDRDISVIVVGENAARKDKVLGIVSGTTLKQSSVAQVLGKELNVRMERLGYKECAKNDINYQECDESYNTFMAKESLVNQYLTWMQEFINSEYMIDVFIRQYSPIEKADLEEIKRPFLSIVTRTQGKRSEALRETLLSLAGQSCMDFEVMVMGHKLSKEQKENVEQIIADVPEFLSEKIRFILVEDGNRTTPINRGFELARGQYAVILDDDDLVFDNWVSSFKEKAEDYPGRVLHAYVIAQDWCTVKTKDGIQGLRACGSPQNQFCKDFHWLTELNGNYCPVLGLAFPLYPFKELGIRFDETLDTTEDWDFLMRISALCGVADIQRPTSIYRLWRNIENSYSLHDDEVWKNNHKKIQNKFKSKPILLPKEYVGNLIEAVENYGDVFDESLRKKEFGQITALYLNHGSGYSEKWSVHSSTKVALPDFKYEFSELETYGEIHQIRWDPYDRGGIMLDQLQVNITFKDGRQIEKNIGQVSSNGFRSRGKIVILHSDPQVYITLAKKEVISKIVVTGHLFKRVPDEEYEYISAAYDSNIIKKTTKHGKRLAKKAIARIRKRD